MKSIYTLVGMHHQKATGIVARMRNGEPVTLKREPDNAYDPNAVKVFLGDQALGYIKGTEAVVLARQLDLVDGPFQARYVAHRYPQIEVDNEAISVAVVASTRRPPKEGTSS